MTEELAKVYDPRSVEAEVYALWQAERSFAANPADPRPAFCVVIPPPNVTAALHLGHALNNTLQDVLVRFRRMQQHNTLWMPGTDHAGIATQTVVEKRIMSEENKRRTDFSRQDFVARIQEWKDEYEASITNQLQKMGCSCDWDRQRFTMDEVCAKAVRSLFFKLFSDGLIYRGKRLVNWDPATQTVLADDEVEHVSIDGHFWYLRYPLVRSTGILPVSPTGILPVDASAIDKRHGAHLPHWTKEGATYAVTFRLGDSVPASVINRWKKEREEIVLRAQSQGRPLSTQERKALHQLYSARVESFLDAGQGACHLRTPEVAKVVQDALHHFDGQRYELIAWAVMPNHVHAVVRPLPGHELDGILHSWKFFTAKQANSILGRQGPFWQEEYYDHLIRDEEDFCENVSYALANPAKAGLDKWPWVGAKKQGQDGPATHGQDAHATHGQDAHATHGQDAHATNEPPAIDYITVATTRPETMLGDTAVAMNPRDPRAAALVGRKVRLPIVGREIPIIADEHVVLSDPDSADEKARFSTGFLKVTPAHDPDDYAIGQRHLDEIAGALRPGEHLDEPTKKKLVFINVMAPDGTISDKHGWQDANAPEAQNLLGMDRFEARQAVVEFFRAEGLLEEVRPYRHPVGHSYRSHVPIEPYLSDQWYVAVKKSIADCGLRNADCPESAAADRGAGSPERSRGTDWTAAHPDLVEEREGIHYLANTDVPVDSLAGLALAPLMDGRLHFTPERYAITYRTWLENLRDWPISRQLWWGHQIPVWRAEMSFSEFKSRYSPAAASLISESGDVCISAVREDGSVFAISGRAGAYEEFARLRDTVQPDEPLRWYVCLRNEESELLCLPEGTTWEQRREEGIRRDQEWLSVASGREKKSLRRVKASEFLATAGFVRDQDVLDTWFSSGLWPFSTLGWPDQTPELVKYYPGDVLCTAREIITLWVSRMVMLGQYCCGDIPFRDVFIHAMIQDGQGRKMSKSLGNGIDPLVVIDSHGADAMRFTLVSMTTQTQDVRMPLKEIELPDGRKVNSSEKFDLGRNFCNKLWNASRFALMNLAGAPPWQTIRPKTNLADAWILSRLNSTIRDTTAAIESFRFNELADTLYHFMWDDLCDWYLEIAKTRIGGGAREPKAVLAHCLDVLLRLLHPIMPFITEEIWGKLNSVAPDRGPTGERAERLLVTAQWPYADAAAISQLVEDEFALLQDLIRQIRNARLEHNVPPKQAVNLAVEATGALANLISENADLMRSLANVDRVSVQAELGERPANAAAINSGSARLYVLDIIDTAAERSRLTKQAETLRKGIATIEGKLGNDNFLAKAPADLVQRERDRLAKLQADLAAVDAGLAALG